MKQVEVQIMGQSYLLACPPGGESSLLDAVERVDTAMCRIRDAGKVKARDRIAVLASLNLAFELSQKESEAFTSPSTFGPRETTAFSAAGTAVASSESDPATETRMHDLLRRLDEALGSDGQLI
ncbi:cell division protein ZapA [Hydrogenophaga sp. PAMC20947]|uniref:cell division protein ZapA n=1 Tax=Hydrogenophaga sp. PAMC20947 TaxID=2565558 RepID=UPI00109E023B|nr:cell division protein ZapA [Hydrogenophaga sp. PAMC20947]QCB48621.1 cell division protein ZapA [Hydrogenophaga sp. PAMC20947]